MTVVRNPEAPVEDSLWKQTVAERSSMRNSNVSRSLSTFQRFRPAKSITCVIRDSYLTGADDDSLDICLLKEQSTLLTCPKSGCRFATEFRHARLQSSLITLLVSPQV
jgi:hypothetical protein